MGDHDHPKEGEKKHAHGGHDETHKSHEHGHGDHKSTHEAEGVVDKIKEKIHHGEENKKKKKKKDKKHDHDHSSSDSDSD
ncbi:drought-induced protein [Genlisea aurea]|uniref:Drought-induced protein n=1 Tax=Genlisea aurea TaxID=192259 RepID=S8E3K2_9LAMI|nr:drought-induced protein [Genlisea aurea]